MGFQLASLVSRDITSSTSNTSFHHHILQYLDEPLQWTPYRLTTLPYSRLGKERKPRRYPLQGLKGELVERLAKLIRGLSVVHQVVFRSMCVCAYDTSSKGETIGPRFWSEILGFIYPLSTLCLPSLGSSSSDHHLPCGLSITLSHRSLPFFHQNHQLS